MLLSLPVARRLETVTEQGKGLVGGIPIAGEMEVLSSL